LKRSNKKVRWRWALGII